MKNEVCPGSLALDLTGSNRSRSCGPAIRLCTLLLFCVVIAGCSETATDKSPDSVEAEDPAVSVQVAEATVTTLRPRLDLIGTIVAVPERTAVVSPQLGGWIRDVNVVEGQLVSAGDVLVTLDARSAEVAVQRTRAVIAEKEAAVKRLKRGYLPQEIAGAHQDAEQAEATVDGLSNELSALKDLLDRREISPVLYQTKAKALESAEAAWASAKERAKLLEAGTRPELIAEAESLLAVARADLKQAELALEWCTISSPIDGLVVQLQARKGQYFERAVSLATIIDLSNVFVRVRIPSRDLSKVQVGTQIDVQLNSFPGRTFPGSVARMSGQADPMTGNVIAYASVENKDRLLLPGLSCNTSVTLPAIPDALAIPVAAIADNSGSTVVTVIRDGKAYETEVEIGIETQDLVQVLKGLSAGDVVATAGGYGLPDGCPVRTE